MFLKLFSTVEDFMLRWINKEIGMLKQEKACKKGFSVRI